MIAPHTYNLRFFILLATFAFAFSFSSCRKKKKKKQQQTTTEQVSTGPCKTDHRPPLPLIDSMRKKEFHFQWFSGKLECEASDDSSSTSFDVNVRMRCDSAIWLNVTLQGIGINVARALITKDSVKLTLRSSLSEQKCFQGDFAYLSQLLQTDVDYEMLQSLLIGNSVSFYEDEAKLKSSINQDDCSYTLSTVRKRKLKKVLEGQKQPDEPLQTISLDPSTFKILKILFIDASNRTFTATYSSFSPEDSVSFPHHAVFYAKGVQKSATIDITYKHINLSKHFDFPFSFPDDCTPISVPTPPQQDQQQQHH